MNEPHPDLEKISALIDGEIGADERAGIARHLAECSQCAAAAESMRLAVRSVAALPQVAPTVDESRSLRLGLLESAPSRRGRAWLPRIWAAAGVTAVVIIAAVGFNMLPRQKAARTHSALKGVAVSELPELEFSSEEEVRDVVAAQPEVNSAKNRWRVADVGERQEEVIQAFSTGPTETSSDTTTQGSESIQSAERSKTTSNQVAVAPAMIATRSAPDCLRATLRGQPYPMMPVSARAATYKGQPVWLLVYAWTTSSNPNAPLDRLQIWLVTRTDCTPVVFQQLRL